MPRRKHKQKQGKHGPIIKVAPGVIVRQDNRGKYLLCISKGGKRYSKTFGFERNL